MNDPGTDPVGSNLRDHFPLLTEQSYIMHAWKRSDLVAQIAATLMAGEVADDQAANAGVSRECPGRVMEYLGLAEWLVVKAEAIEEEREGRGA